MAPKVEFHPLAETDPFGLYDYIATRSGPAIAGGYLDRIQALCADLSIMPERGTRRDDLAPRLRTLSMDRRVLVVYRPQSEAVLILRVIYAGRDFTADDLPH